MCEGMGEQERRAVEFRVAAAIGNAQDVVYEMMCAYHVRNRQKVAETRALEEAAWQDTREERRRHAQRADQGRRREQEAAAERARAHARAAATAAARARDDAARKRREGARRGGEAPVTRAMSCAGSVVREESSAASKRVRTAAGARGGERTPSAPRAPRRKAVRVPKALVRDLKVRDRWHWQPMVREQGWRVWYQESADLWRVRFVVKRSELMANVPGATGHMYGLYAAHRFESMDPLTVYVGVDIGAVDGAVDDYQGYRAMERMARDFDGGRHVMQIDGRLVDGVGGYACAQYINSAYRMTGWCNKA